MPEILKNSNGETDWSKVFMAFAAALVLVMQQYQGYRIAVIQAEAKAQSQNFMSRKEIYGHIKNIEDNFLAKDVILTKFQELDRRVDALENKK